MGVIYIMMNWPYIWKVKIGITGTGKGARRRKSVSETTPGFAFRVWSMVLPFGTAGLEKRLHQLFKAFRSPFSKGSGKTEWFLLPVAPIAWLIINVTALLYWSPILLVIWLALRQLAQESKYPF